MLLALTCALTAATFLLSAMAARYANERHLSFLILALWSRFALSAFPETTTVPLVAGQSLNALGSLAVVGVGVLITNRKTFLLRPLLPLYLFIAVVIASGLINSEISGLISGGMRLAYLIVVAAATAAAIERSGLERTIRFLVPAFLLPLALLWASVGLGVDQATLRDYQLEPWQEAKAIGVSYVGTYDHESTIGLILLSLLLLLPFWKTRARLAVFVLAALAFGGLLFTNYRTAILAAIPLAAPLFLFHYFALFPRYAKSVAALLLPALLVAGAGLLLSQNDLMARFSDLSRLGEMDFTRGPAEMTETDREIMSGRYVIWTNYLHAWLDGGTVQRLIGFGPESWRPNFNTYAHNTFVSFLYEFGLIGTLLFLVFWVGLFRTCARAREPYARLTLLSAAFGFLLLNFATMPMWKIEGMINLGLINGLALFFAAHAQRLRAGEPIVVTGVRRSVIGAPAGAEA